MIEAFRALGRFLDQYRVKRDDVEIIIRCKRRGIDYTIAAGLQHEIDQVGFVRLFPARPEPAGTIDGIPFTIEAAPRDG